MTWNQPSQFSRNYALAGYDRPHMLQLGFVYELPFAREQSNPLALVVKNWQINGIGSWLSGTPFTVGGDNGLLQQPGGIQTINVTGDPSRASARPARRAVVRPSAFTQPGNAWGNSGRNAFRGPSNWNLDFSVFRAFPFGRYRVEFRAESQNVFNHAQWANPVTGLHRPELHAHPHAGARTAHGAAGHALPVLVRPTITDRTGAAAAAPVFFVYEC